MVILLTGATGFIGARLAAALVAAGHVVVEASRHAANERAVQADFTRDLDPSVWLPRLSGVDVVVNAVGILREQGEQTFERVHTLAPKALFDACTVAGVSKVIQISALGADTGVTPYFSSKRAADEYLETQPIDWTIVQPALVYGSGGTSARLFTMLASLPIIPLPGNGRQCVQPIHVEDLVAAIVTIVASGQTNHQRIALTGPRAMTLRDLLGQLRLAMRLRPTVFVPVPMWLMRAGARIVGLSSRSLLDRDTLTMLAAGNVADPAMTQQLLQRPPRSVDAFIDARSQRATLLQARLAWLLPLLRISIAAVWIWTGIVSFGLYPRESSYELLRQVGITGNLAPVMLYSAATVDVLLGLATLVLAKRRLLWLAQIAVILVYTVIITIALPVYWLHPYGPIVKNLPLLAAILLLHALEDPR